MCHLNINSNGVWACQCVMLELMDLVGAKFFPMKMLLSLKCVRMFLRYSLRAILSTQFQPFDVLHHFRFCKNVPLILLWKYTSLPKFSISSIFSALTPLFYTFPGIEMWSQWPHILPWWAKLLDPTKAMNGGEIMNRLMAFWSTIRYCLGFDSCEIHCDPNDAIKTYLHCLLMSL